MLLPATFVTLLTSTLALAATYHDVQVGVDDKGASALVYTPSEVTAEIGDVVRFHFRPKNHTVTLGSFETPCIAVKDDKGKPAWTTGFVPVDPQKSLVWSAETFRDLEVWDKDPHPFYCQQQAPTPHCGAGMVFVLNPYGDKNQYKAAELAKAQNGTATASATATTTTAPQATETSASSPPGSPKIHYVEVGPGGKFIFDPPYVHPGKGDIVRFLFNPKNHSVTESNFFDPCRKKVDGFNSGFRPVKEVNKDSREQFDVVIDDPYTQRTVYCAQGLGTDNSHCERLGPMVFVISPEPEGPKSVDAIKAAALATVLGAPPKKVIPVQVGPNGQFVFDPPNIKAAKGDIINFLFNPKNHSVTESLANDPCRRKQGGFDSGFNPVDPMNFNPANSPTFNITVDDPSIPQYAYCSQGLGTDKSHCERLGPMLVTINAPDSGPGSLDEVKKAALATVLGAPPKNASGSASGGTIAMVGGGAAAAVASLAGVAFFFIRRRSLRKRGSYANIDETTAPLGDRPELGEFSIPMHESTNRSSMAMGEGEGESGGRDSPAGQRPLLASRTSA